MGAVAPLEQLERHQQPAVDDERRLGERLNLGPGGERGTPRHQYQLSLADRQAVALAERTDVETAAQPLDDRLELDQQSRGGRAESERRRGAAHLEAPGAGAGKHHGSGRVGFGGIFLGAKRCGRASPLGDMRWKSANSASC